MNPLDIESLDRGHERKLINAADIQVYVTERVTKNSYDCKYG
jgi:hypothetical protein